MKIIKIISINEFMDREFKFCFVCGSKKYCQFYFNDHLYRVCAKCLNKIHEKEMKRIRITQLKSKLQKDLVTNI